MDPNSQNIIHDLGDNSAARIRKVRRDEKVSSATILYHPGDIVKKRKGMICGDELSLCCVNYMCRIVKELCQNPDNSKVTKFSCLMQLIEDDNVTSLAVILLGCILDRMRGYR